ncbi:UNVERIFIED_CONTAM: UPF0434 protein [Trichonephila clavipes]
MPGLRRRRLVVSGCRCRAHAGLRRLAGCGADPSHTGVFVTPSKDCVMDLKLLDILACPICKGPLQLSEDKTELISKGAGVAYPIRDGIPVMLESEARTLTTDERLDK